MRKITTLLLTLFLMCSVSITVFAQEVIVNTSVPDSHTLTVTADHAQVLYQGHSDSNFEIPRLSEPTLLICADDGYKLSKVTLNGENITDKVIGNYYTLAPVYEDKKLVVETIAVPIASDSIHDISGTVTDENGKPIAGVTVYIGGKTDVTDKNGNFKVEGVPNGNHSVKITDKDGKTIGYTKLDISEGELKVTNKSDGSYAVTVPKNAPFYIKLVVQTNSKDTESKPADNKNTNNKTTIDSVQNVTPTRPGSTNILQTGDFSNTNLWLSLMSASATALFIVIYMNRKKNKPE